MLFSRQERVDDGDAFRVAENPVPEAMERALATGVVRNGEQPAEHRDVSLINSAARVGLSFRYGAVMSKCHAGLVTS